jgi:hypothetical protein
MSKSADPFSYLAKYVTKHGGDLHFGGTLQKVNFSFFSKSIRRLGRRNVVYSADLGWRFFHLNDPRRKK